VQERLQKILARAGFASRRTSEELIAHGRVTVNGTTIREMGSKADIGEDDIRVDGVRVRAPERLVYLLLNKPKGYVTTRKDPERRPTVMDLVPSVPGLFPVGRLDVTTEGLILLTNDGAFAERVAHPRYEIRRVYHAKVHKVPERDTLDRIRRGIIVEGDRLAVDEARVIESDNNAWVELALHEGKHHEIKRLLEAVGHPVSKLKRVAIGPLTARGLEVGAFRELAPFEVQGLLRGKVAPPSAHAKRPSLRPHRDDRRRTAPPAGRSTTAGRSTDRTGRSSETRSTRPGPSSRRERPATAGARGGSREGSAKRRFRRS
jgi:23S rRNA pseudouridine2605 synthase